MFAAAVDHALRNLQQSTGDDLLGFQMDADAVLAEEDLLINASADLSEDPRQKLVLSATLSDAAGTLLQVEDILWRVWRSIAYPDFQATHLARSADAMRLAFLTAAPGLCVTGVIQVGGARYQKLFRKGR